MFSAVCSRRSSFPFFPAKWMFSFGLVVVLSVFLLQNLSAQQFQPQYFAPQTNNQNYLRSSSAFRQEIARFEISVHREGKQPLPLSQVPRVQQGDLIKIKLLDEAVNGVKLDQSLYNWTMLVAFINPNRKFVDGKSKAESRESGVGSENPRRSKFSNGFADTNSGNTIKSDKESSVSNEINFRKTGWYKEYSFTVPYDSQPIFFLYPRPNYRGKILNLINKNYKEIKALGEKTIEIAGAYGQISLFLNELQGVISGNGYYGSGYGSGYGSSPYGSGVGGYNSYGGTGSYNSGSYGGYNSGIYNNYNSTNNYNGYNQAYNYNLFIAQAVERMARGFNISLPNNCWQGSQSFANSTTYNNYNSYGSYNSGYNNGINTGLNQVFQPPINPELVSRLQCVAKNIRLEDFDLSVSKLLQQGGMLLAVQLQQKYPQLSYWINVAALAIDLIVKITRKSPLRIVPAVTSSSDNPNAGSYGSSGSYQSSPGFQNNYSSNYANRGTTSTYSPNSPNSGNSGNSANFGNSNNQPMPKISLFAESQPDDNQFVTAYPIVLHKWQPEADTEVISLRPPILAEPCLHAGVNILKSTDLSDEQLEDNFTKDYLLTMTSTNGFKKEFPLRKNLGLNGWELNITPQDLQDFPKIQMTLESTISGTRGFNEIKSPPFYLPIAIGGNWQITPESQQNFTVGGKRTITIKNTLGNCQCLQAVIYKPSFGGQFVFEANQGGSNGSSNNNGNNNNQNRLNYSPDGKEVSFEVDATTFQAGAGEIELRTYGGEAIKIPLKLYPAPPNVTNLKIGKGDREGIISGERLEQIQALRINGRRATVIGNQSSTSAASVPNSANYQSSASLPNYQGSPTFQNPNQPLYNGTQPGFPAQPTYPNQALNNGVQANNPGQVNPSTPTTPTSGNAGNSVNLGNYLPNLQINNQNERVIVLAEANAKLTENTASIELELEDNRTVQVRQTFAVAPSRPTIVANENREIEAVAVNSGSSNNSSSGSSSNNDNQVFQVYANNQRKGQNQKVKVKASSPKSKDQSSIVDLSKLAVFPLETKQLSFNVQNALTDYDFKVENLSLETRMEKQTGNNNNGYGTPGYNPGYNNYGGTDIPLPKVEFEILDWKNLRISLQLTEQLQKLLGGRRLQFRIRDKERGDSDWYSIKQTFVRIPNISSIVCTTEMNKLCELKGNSIDYISQVSIDGGQSWYPQAPATLQVQPTEDGSKLAMIPHLPNKKLLMIKLRDYPSGEGLFINGFSFTNSVKVVKSAFQGTPPTQPTPTNQSNQPITQFPNQANNQMIQTNQNLDQIQNQPNQEKSSLRKTVKKKKN